MSASLSLGFNPTQIAAVDYGERVHLQERFAELELGLEDRGWLRFANDTEREFSRTGLNAVVRLSRLMYIKNPLVNRGVNVAAFYVWAQGVTIRNTNPERDQRLQQFIADNRSVILGHQARTALEVELRVTGNLFLAYQTNPISGRVACRPIIVEEISEIITEPNDKWTPILYRRTWSQSSIDFNSGQIKHVQAEEYYPDWKWRPVIQPPTFGGKRIRWDSPVQHIRVGNTGDSRFGIPETYQALDWAKAYTEFCSDWASISRSLSRFAWAMTTKGGISRLKDKIQTTLGVGGTGDEQQPPPISGSTFISRGVELTPIPKTGAQVSMEDGRRLLLMVAAAQGLPESFYGDVSVGTLATAKSLDRPTELMFKDRQSLWADEIAEMEAFIAISSARAVSNPLSGIQLVPDGNTLTVEIDDRAAGVTEVRFPPIIEHDVDSVVTAIVKAATLDGKDAAGIIEEEIVGKMLLAALSEQGVGQDLIEQAGMDEDFKQQVREVHQKLVEQRRLAA